MKIMKRLMFAIAAFTLVVTLLPGFALAASVPTAMSYFTCPEYNKAYIGDDGYEHKMEVKWVAETWNKVGTAIYDIHYYDTYENENETHIDMRVDTVIFNNARTQYPNSTRYSVYSIKWYPDGHFTVTYDHRPEPTCKTTTATIFTPRPTPKPTSKPTPKPTPTKGTKPKSTIKSPTLSPLLTLVAASTATKSSMTAMVTADILTETQTAISTSTSTLLTSSPPILSVNSTPCASPSNVAGAMYGIPVPNGKSSGVLLIFIVTGGLVIALIFFLYILLKSRRA